MYVAGDVDSVAEGVSSVIGAALAALESARAVARDLAVRHGLAPDPHAAPDELRAHEPLGDPASRGGRAVEAALRMQDGLEKLNEAREGVRPIDFRAGGRGCWSVAGAAS